MKCEFVEVSVLNDIGIEALFDKVLDKCMSLHDYLQSIDGGKGNKDNEERMQVGFKLSRESLVDKYQGITPVELR